MTNRGRESEKEGEGEKEKERSSILLYTPQMTTTAKPDQAEARRLELHWGLRHGNRDPST